MRWLRYYSPNYDQNRHFEILNLLEEINKRARIKYEEIPIKRREWYDREPVMNEVEVYEKHLKPQTKVIKENVGETVAKLFKSHSGNIYVAGTVCVVEDGYVIWCERFKQLDFLNKVLKNPDIIYRFRSGKGKTIADIHSDLFRKLKENNLPNPEISRNNKIWVREIVTGFRRVNIDPNNVRTIVSAVLEDIKNYGREVYEFYRHIENLTGTLIVDKLLYRKYLQKEISDRYGFGSPLFVVFADFLVITPESNWLLEGKESLNYEAIGQVLVYKDLMEEDYPELGDIKMGIVCYESDKRIEKTCKKLRINVFTV